MVVRKSVRFLLLLFLVRTTVTTQSTTHHSLQLKVNCLIIAYNSMGMKIHVLVAKNDAWCSVLCITTCIR